MSQEQSAADIVHLRELIVIHTRNLQALEQQAATYGSSSIPLHLLNDINFCRNSIATCERAIEALRSPKKAELPSTSVQAADLKDILTVFLLVEVHARQSGQVVDLLESNYEEVKEAAAVYADTDVVVRISATKSRIADILLDLLQETVEFHEPTYNVKDSYEIDTVRPYLVEGTLLSNKNHHTSDLKGDICAYIMIDIDPRQGTRAKVLRELKKLDGIVYSAGFTQKTKAIVKVRCPNKKSFDGKVMDEIQRIPGVATTRSLIVINEMHFVR